MASDRHRVWRRHLAVCAAVALASSSAAFPAAAGAGPAPANRGWALDDADPAECILARRDSSDPGQTVILRSYPGSGRSTLIWARLFWPRTSRALDQGIKLVLLPSGTQFDRLPDVVAFGGDLGNGLVFPFLPDAFLSGLSGSSMIALVGRKQAAFEMPLGEAAGAVEAFRRCERRKLLEWGADPAGLAPGGSQPRPYGDDAQWITEKDLGIARTVARASVGGALKLKIGKDGRATECSVLATEGKPLPASICAALVRRARYEPARDAAGEPVVGIATYVFSWTVANAITAR